MYTYLMCLHVISDGDGSNLYQFSDKQLLIKEKDGWKAADWILREHLPGVVCVCIFLLRAQWQCYWKSSVIFHVILRSSTVQNVNVELLCSCTLYHIPCHGRVFDGIWYAIGRGIYNILYLGEIHMGLFLAWEPLMIRSLKL